LQDEIICVLLAWHILLTLVAFVYPNQIANPSFNTVKITLANQIKIKIFTEDTMETASHFVHKDCLQTYYNTLEFHAQRCRDKGIN
jgi:hypothetical protein